MIKKRIESAKPGDIFVTSDFVDIAIPATVRKCLSRLVEDKKIRRVMDGIYEKPIYSTFLNDYMPANPDIIAHAIARNFNWTIAPSGDLALNKLGLSTQIPVLYRDNHEFIRNFATRKINFLELKHESSYTTYRTCVCHHQRNL